MVNPAITVNIAWGVTQDKHEIWELYKSERDSHLKSEALYYRARSVIVHDRALRILEP